MKKFRPSIAVAVFAVGLHFYFNSYYGYQRDELYFIACGEHLDWGYVDVGPLAMWLGRLSREILGESLFALRFFPALSRGAAVIVAGALAMRFGAGMWGQFVAALSLLLAPVWLLGNNVLSLPAFEPLFWSLSALFLLLAMQTDNSRYLAGLGVAAGFGLLNKPSMAFFGFGLIAGLAFTPNRKYFRDKWLYISAAIALIIASPFIYWQYTHGWATLQFMTNLNRDIMSRITPLEFLLGQLLYIGPLNALLWGGALVWMFSASGKQYRIFGWIFLAVFLFLLVVKSKIYYLSPAYPMMLAAGAAAWRQWLSNRRTLRIAMPVAMTAASAVIAPAVLPILPIEKVDGYLNAVTGGFFKDVYEITNTFHDMIGWEEEVQAVAKVYNRLPPGEKADSMIFGGNFGISGAVDFYGPKYGLPKSVSGHQNYYFWGPPERWGKVTIVVGADEEDLAMVFESYELADVFKCPLAADKETPIHLCRKPKIPPGDVWAILRSRAFNN